MGETVVVNRRTALGPSLWLAVAVALLWLGLAAGAASAQPAGRPIELDKVLFWSTWGKAYTDDGHVITLNPPQENAYWSAFRPDTGEVHGTGWYAIHSGTVVEEERGFGKVSPLQTEGGTYQVESLVRFTPWGACATGKPACRTRASGGPPPTAERLGGLIEMRIVLRGVLKTGVQVTRRATLYVGAPDGSPPTDAFAGIKVRIDGGQQFMTNHTYAHGKPVEGKYGTEWRQGKGTLQPLGEGISHIFRLNNTPVLAHLRGKPFRTRRAAPIQSIDEWYDIQSVLLTFSTTEGDAAGAQRLALTDKTAAYARRPVVKTTPVKISGVLSFVDLNKTYDRIPGEIPATGPDNWWFAFYGNAWTKPEGGKSIMFNRQGYSTIWNVFNIKTGESHGGGWYYMKDEKGALTEVGVWSVLEVKSFDSFGQNLAPQYKPSEQYRDPGPPLNPHGPAGNEQPAIRDAGQNARGKTGFFAIIHHDGIDPMAETVIHHGGLIVFTVEMRGVSVSDGKATLRTTVVYDGCVDGQPPIWAWEGAKVDTVEGETYLHNKTVNAQGRRTPVYGPWPGDGFSGNGNQHNTPLYAHLVGKPFNPDDEAYLNMRTIDDWRLAHTVSVAGSLPPYGHFALIAGDRWMYPPHQSGLAAETLGLEAGIYCPPPPEPRAATDQRSEARPPAADSIAVVPTAGGSP